MMRNPNIYTGIKLNLSDRENPYLTHDTNETGSFETLVLNKLKYMMKTALNPLVPHVSYMIHGLFWCRD